MLVAVVFVLFTLKAATGNTVPDETPAKLVTAPFRPITTTVPLPPTHKARHGPPGKLTLSLGVTAACMPDVEVIALMDSP